MARPHYEVADVIRKFLPQMAPLPLVYHQKVLSALARCRTAQLGGHVDACDQCGHIRISYNSCRNRHCPKCQGVNKEMWLVQQQDMLLPVSYFHVVFTLPHEFNGLCMHNPAFMYDLLFKSAWHVINSLARDPKWIGAKTAATMVLHTWSQSLILHPHLHCIVPNGGLDHNGQWAYPKRGKDNFLFPVQAMKKLHKGFFMQRIKQAVKLGQIILPPNFPTAPKNYSKWKNNLYAKQWVVYTKKPFSAVKNVIDYLGRYSHRVAITNHRIKSISDQHVTFKYKDYSDRARNKLMQLTGSEFIRRFCLHILPPRFRKIRHYGFLSNACKAKSIAQARKSLSAKNRTLLTRVQRKALAIERLFNAAVDQCPCCTKGKMKIIMAFGCNKAPPVIKVQPIYLSQFP